MPIGHTVRVGGEAGVTASKSGSTGGKKLNDAIECLLSLRSVRDQFRDAQLDLANDKVAEQLEDLEDRLVDHLAEERALRDGVGLLTVAVVGDFNSGKSTFINALLGTNLCPDGPEPTTASVTHFIYGDKQRFELERDGTRTSIGKGEYRSMVSHSKAGDREAYVFHVSTNSPVLAYIRLVDTPGFNAPPPNSNDTRVTENAVATADALFVITDARKGNPSKTLLEQLDRLQNTRRNESALPAFLLLNKAELLPPSERAQTISHSEKQSDGRFRNVTLVSARRLKNTDEAPPLDALENTTRRIRAALARQKSFEARISARVVTDRGQANYRMDIDGNAYESVSSDGDLASREQLAEMVRSVASNRHTLLERQFQRRTSQLRKDWLKLASGLDGLCKRPAMTFSDAGDATDQRGNEALEEIDDAKFQILERANDIFHEAAEDAVSKGRSDRPRFLSHKTFYHIDVRLDDAYDVMEHHDYWGQVTTIMKVLIESLKRITDVETLPTPDEIAAELRMRAVAIVRESLESHGKELEELEDWERQGGTCWRRVFEDEETLRDVVYNRRALGYRSEASRWALRFSRHLQATIDELRETIIRSDEKGQSTVREREDELTKLRERLDKLKESTP